jgi:HAE1 family hydrophobic/amphiphilic exporter-1
MIFICFIIIGIIASRLIPLEYFPDMDLPFVNIEIPYPGSTPEEIERQITRPVEEVLATISGVKRMVSNSLENQCYIHLRFDWGIDTDLKAVEVREKIDGMRHQLPQDVEHIYLRQVSSTDMEMLQLRLSSNRDLSEYYDMLNRVLKRPLEAIDGVSRVNMYGVEKKEIRIQLLADRITAHRVDLARLSEVLQRSNFLVTAGRITDSNRRFRVKPLGEFQSLKEIKELIIGENNLKLKDIASVTYKQPRLTYGRHLDKKYAVGLDIFKEAGANTVETADRAKKELERIGKDPRMEGISIYFMEDQSEGIISSINELLKAGIIGASLAIFLLFFFLRRLSTTFIVALAVPFSLLVTLAFMYFFNMSLNILSMMGLMLAVGMLVDNAVVVTESIHRYQLQGKDLRDASIIGVKEVAMAITAGTLTTACVFLPNILSPKDEMAIYIKHVSIAFVIALGASLVLAQTVVPLLASRIRGWHPRPIHGGRRPQPIHGQTDAVLSEASSQRGWHPRPIHGQPDAVLSEASSQKFGFFASFYRKLVKKEPKSTIIDRLIKRYGGILDWMLRWRKVSVLIILFILFSVMVPMMVVKKDMFPQHEDRRLFLEYNINGNYTLEKVESTVDMVEEYLYNHQEQFEIKSVYSYYQGDYAISTINLKKGKGVKKSQEQIRREIEKGLPKVAVGNLTFERRRSMGSEDSLKIYLKGKSSAQLVDLSHEVAAMLANVPGLIDVHADAEAGEQEIQVVVDRDRAAQYGFATNQVANMVAVAMRGVNLRRFRDEFGEIDVKVEFQEGDKQTLEQLQNLVLYDQQKQPIKLSTLANFQVRRGPRRIHRENRITSLGVSINLKDITVSQAKEKIQRIMDRYHLPTGCSWSFGSSFDHDAETFNTMMINLLLAICLIYFIMASLFESMIFPAAIVSSIIFAIIGVFWFFMFTNTTFSLMALIGILILIGVVVNNGIVLIDHINRFRSRGLNRHEAIVKAGMERIRPILMTAGTTILSLVPLCIVNTQIGGDGPPYYPMARAIVGGLAFSTIVTLLVLPRIYVLLDDWRLWAGKLIGRANDLSKKPILRKSPGKG